MTPSTPTARSGARTHGTQAHSSQCQASTWPHGGKALSAGHLMSACITTHVLCQSRLPASGTVCVTVNFVKTFFTVPIRKGGLELFLFTQSGQSHPFRVLLPYYITSPSLRHNMVQRHLSMWLSHRESRLPPRRHYADWAGRVRATEATARLPHAVSTGRPWSGYVCTVCGRGKSRTRAPSSE